MSEIEQVFSEKNNKEDFEKNLKIQGDFSKSNEEILNEIEVENAQDAEDIHNQTRHEIPLQDYESMSLEDLVKEAKKLLNTEKVQAIKEHMEAIKQHFEKQYATLLEEKKEIFLDNGGDIKDFSFVLPIRADFFQLYTEYKNKKALYYKELERELHANLARKQDIISEIKNLIPTDDKEWDSSNALKKYKELKEQWYEIGAIPRENYNDIWNQFNFHTENFYDYLKLTKNFQAMDFKHNLEEKNKIIQKAKELLNLSDVSKAYRELQLLHKIWKEQTGPVEKELREPIWAKFNEITKQIHDKRQVFLNNLDKVYEENLQKKNHLIEKIAQIAHEEISSHKVCQRVMNQVETLREEYLKIGKVPLQNRDEVWNRFMETCRKFTRKKNDFYRNLKKTQHENLEKKQELVAIAKANKDSSDWEVITPLMVKIQEDWQKIGHIPQKYTEQLWKEFKLACNEYFNRLNEQKNHLKKQRKEDFNKKRELFDTLKEFKLSGDKDKDMEFLEELRVSWNELSKSIEGSKELDTRFNKILNALYKKLDFNKKEIELLKYNNKLEQLCDSDNSLIREQIFVRKKIDELRTEILKLENNLQFFSNVKEDNPLMKEAIKTIQNRKEMLLIWEEKLKEVRQRNVNIE
ncbi:MAG: DUF349 domain-containing protein [Capnocytophaga sp.]|nr:DUF349 domain-containing protein [Capnocytophaga sp.]